MPKYGRSPMIEAGCTTAQGLSDTEEYSDFWVPPHSVPSHGLVHKKLESLDYEKPSPDVLRDSLQGSAFAKNKIILLKWTLTACVGVFTGLCACLLDLSCDKLSSWRMSIIGEDSGFGILSTVVFTAWNAVLVAGAGVAAIYVAPASIGSGIPEVKAYLNGVGMQSTGLFSLRTYLAKFVGVVMAYSSGIMVGPEGPLVHLGAITGYSVTSGKHIFQTCRSVCPNQSSWVNDRERRDFVSVGAAAGFALAFGAPVGGVLFAFEELASFWSPALMWRTLTATLLGTISLLVFDSILSTPRDDTAKPWVSINAGLITLSGGDEVTMREVPLFIIIGVFGGLFGSIFNKLWKLKIKSLNSACLTKLQRLGILLLISVTTSLLLFSLPALFGTESCRPRDRFTSDSRGTDEVWIKFGCRKEEVF